MEHAYEYLHFGQLKRSTEGLVAYHCRNDSYWLGHQCVLDNLEQDVSNGLIWAFFDKCHVQVPVFNSVRLLV